MLPTVTVPPPRLHLADEQARWYRFPIEMAPVLWIFGLKRRDQGSHREEVIAADIERQRWIGRIAMKVGEIVGVRNGELEAPGVGVIVSTTLPGRIDGGRIRLAGQARRRLGEHRCHENQQSG